MSRPPQIQNEILEALENGPLKIAALTDQLGRNASSVSGALYKLIDKGKIKSEGKRSTGPHIFSLTKKKRKVVKINDPHLQRKIENPVEVKVKFEKPIAASTTAKEVNKEIDNALAMWVEDSPAVKIWSEIPSCWWPVVGKLGLMGTKFTLEELAKKVEERL